jgi:hypothetical protein
MNEDPPGPPRVLTIDCATWRYGGLANEQNGKTALLNREGFMCCLGFDALACGLGREDILDAEEPENVRWLHADRDSALRRYKETRIDAHSAWAAINDAIAANDSQGFGLTFPKRCQRVRTALMKLGWDDVVFVNVPAQKEGDDED